ncbi:hypothetical protein N7454_000261 [Penicillium verhagenii]|nr:hypothetical protein N7454_000261 [Penicillium verhagenii]
MGFSKPKKRHVKPPPTIPERTTRATSPKWKKKPYKNPLRKYRNPLPTILEDPLLEIEVLALDPFHLPERRNKQSPPPSPDVPGSLTHPPVPLQAADPLGRSWAQPDLEDERSISTGLRGFRRKTSN